MEASAKRALATTRELHKRLKALEEGCAGTSESSQQTEFKALKKLAAESNRSIQAMNRAGVDEAVRANVRENLLREAVRDELIDREANAARVADKQRTLLEGQGPSVLTAFDRSIVLAKTIEVATTKLFTYQVECTSGVALLAEADGALEAAPSPSTGQEVPKE